MPTANPIAKFPIFEANQVLTSDHLNDLFEYLELEDRSTRVCAIGSGILRGLQATFDTQRSNDFNAEKGNIILYCGCALSSDGYLLNSEQSECVLGFATRFEDQGGYAHWVGDDERPAATHDIWLLQEEPSDPDDAVAVAEEHAAVAANLTDHVLVLYAECDEEDLQFCTLEDCNDRGKEVRIRIRVLLVHREDLDTAASISAAKEGRFIRMDRVINEFQNAQQMNDAYRNVCNDVITRLTANLNDVINEALAVIRPKPLPVSTAVDTSGLQTMLGQYDVSGQIQAFYDFLRDVTWTHNAIVCDMLDYRRYADCPDREEFPKHVAVAAWPENLTGQYRHEFVAARVTERQDRLGRRLGFHVLKLANLVSHLISAPLPADRLSLLPQDSVAPSTNVIPYYYRQANVLRAIWAADGCRNHYPSEWIHSWHDDGDDWQNVIKRNIDDQRFIRIDGMQAQADVNRVVAFLEKWRRQGNLAFNIWPVHFDTRLSAAEIRGLCGYSALTARYATARLAIYKCFEALRLQLATHEIAPKTTYGYVDDKMPSASPLVESLNDLLSLLDNGLEKFDIANFSEAYEQVLKVNARFRFQLGSFEQRAAEGCLFSGGGRLGNSLTKSNPAFYFLLGTVLNQLRQQLDVLVHCCIWVAEIVAVAETLQARQALSQHIFANFKNHNPAFDHGSGSPVGGTVVLLYESIDERKVLADFFLSHVCCEHCEDAVEVAADVILPIYLECRWENKLQLLIKAESTEEVLVRVGARWRQVTKAGVKVSDSARLSRSEDVLILESTAAAMNTLLNLDLRFGTRRLRSGALRIEEFEPRPLGRVFPPTRITPGMTISGGSATAPFFRAGFPITRAAFFEDRIRSLLQIDAGVSREVRLSLALRRPAAVLADDVAATVEGEAVMIKLLANDIVPPMPFSLKLSNPKNGNVRAVDNETALVEYSPDREFTGCDRFEYELEFSSFGRTFKSKAGVDVWVVPCCEPDAAPQPPPDKRPKVELPAGPFCIIDGDRTFVIRDGVLGITGDDVFADVTVHIARSQISRREIKVGNRMLLGLEARPLAERRNNVVVVGDSTYDLKHLAIDLELPRRVFGDIRVVVGFKFRPTTQGNRLVKYSFVKADQVKHDKLTRKVLSPFGNKAKIIPKYVSEGKVEVSFEHVDADPNRFDYEWFIDRDRVSNKEKAVVTIDRKLGQNFVVSARISLKEDNDCFVLIEEPVKRPGRTTLADVELIDIGEVLIRIEDDGPISDRAGGTNALLETRRIVSLHRSLTDDEAAARDYRVGAFDTALLPQITDAIDTTVLIYKESTEGTASDDATAIELAKVMRVTAEISLDYLETQETVTDEHLTLARKTQEGLKRLASRDYDIDVEKVEKRVQFILSKPVRA